MRAVVLKFLSVPLSTRTSKKASSLAAFKTAAQF
jgi:hypothetical protein